MDWTVGSRYAPARPLKPGRLGTDQDLSEARCRRADAKIDAGTFVISAASVKSPKVSRYAWAANPVCNFVNPAGLPAVPSRIDAPAR